MKLATNIRLYSPKRSLYGTHPTMQEMRSMIMHNDFYIGDTIQVSVIDADNNDYVRCITFKMYAPNEEIAYEEIQGYPARLESKQAFIEELAMFIHDTHLSEQGLLDTNERRYMPLYSKILNAMFFEQSDLMSMHQRLLENLTEDRYTIETTKLVQVCDIVLDLFFHYGYAKDIEENVEITL